MSITRPILAVAAVMLVAGVACARAFSDPPTPAPAAAGPEVPRDSACSTTDPDAPAK